MERPRSSSAPPEHVLAPTRRLCEAPARLKSTLKRESRVKVELTEYPYFAGTMMTPDPALLDQLASEYAARRNGNDPPVMTRFLFADVPVVLFDNIFTAADPAQLPLGSYLWLYHLSGYYGGLWLRGELLQSGHNRMIENVNLPQSEEQFTAEVGDAKNGPRPRRRPPTSSRTTRRASTTSRTPRTRTRRSAGSSTCSDTTRATCSRSRRSRPRAWSHPPTSSCAPSTLPTARCSASTRPAAWPRCDVRPHRRRS